MTANYVNVDEEIQQKIHHHHDHHHHHQQQAPSPRSFRRSLSSNSSTTTTTCAQGAAPKCVCAPATHAGSFKCRLHRVSSHGQAAPSAPMTRSQSVSSSSTRTVEAQ